VREQPEIRVDIAPNLRRHITPIELFQSQFSFTFGYLISNFLESGFLFRVISPSYHLEMGFSKNSIYLSRNGIKIENSFDDLNKENHFILVVGYVFPSGIKLTILDNSYSEAADVGADLDIEFRNRTVQQQTVPVYPPNTLIDWVRRQNLVERITYPSKEDFYQAVSSALQSIEDKVKSLGMFHPFWDVVREGNRIIRRVPKREADILPTIKGFLVDICLLKNFQIAGEYPTASGFLDYLITGVLTSGELVQACIEFKHAHSRQIENGLLSQLPTYMKAQGCDFGLYCVMWFKGRYFDAPSIDTDHDLHIHLHTLALENGLTNMKILVYDFSVPSSPSIKI